MVAAAGVFAASVPVATFLANLVPWSQSAHPAVALYGTAVGLAAAIGLIAALGPWRRDPLAAFGVICLFTLVVLGVDVMTGSGLQLETPFGLSVLEAGRFYGIGNEALGIYGITALFAAAWLGLLALRRSPRLPAGRRSAWSRSWRYSRCSPRAGPGSAARWAARSRWCPASCCWRPAVAGIRLNWRRIGLVAVSGLVLFAVFALISYFVPVTGKSDIGAFAGDVLHGHAGWLLLRKINSNIGSLSVSAFSPVLPIVVVMTGLMLWRPSWFRLRTVPLAYAARAADAPVIIGVLWLMPVLGWFADDSGVIVPATALPLALPLGIAVLATAGYQDLLERYRDTAVADPAISGPPPSARMSRK